MVSVGELHSRPILLELGLKDSKETLDWFANHTEEYTKIAKLTCKSFVEYMMHSPKTVKNKETRTFRNKIMSYLAEVGDNYRIRVGNQVMIGRDRDLFLHNFLQTKIMPDSGLVWYQILRICSPNYTLNKK